MVSQKRRNIKIGRRDIDNLLYLATGKRAKQIFTIDNILIAAGKLIPVVSDMFNERSRAKEEPLDKSDPYYILGVRRDAPMWVIKAAFRALSREYHPDTGTEPNISRFQEVQEAFRFIKQEQEEKSEPR